MSKEELDRIKSITKVPEPKLRKMYNNYMNGKLRLIDIKKELRLSNFHIKVVFDKFYLEQRHAH